MFSDTINGRPAFEINPGSDQHTIFASNLWMGGLDANSQLHLAAQSYDNSDFFYGPAALGVWSGNQPGYNLVWKITKQEIDDFNDWYQCSITPGCVTNPGYNIPNIILNWPAHGDISQGQNFFLAPFVDYNQDGIYNPYDGDHPCIKGDMAIFTVFNDIGTHLSGGAQIGVEVKAMHYAYAGDPDSLGNDSIFQNTIFSEYILINRSSSTLTDFYVGLWEDMDIGCSDNDYIGCDASRGLAYTYNGTAIDNPYNDPCSSPFGNHPPAQGSVVLKGMKQDADGIDNPLTTDIPVAISQSGIPYEALGCGYGDGTADNEYLGLSGFKYFDRNLPVSIYGDPTNAAQHYDCLNGLWLDGSDLVHGGTGHQSSAGASSVPTQYALTGDSDPFFWSTDGVVASPSTWSETALANPVGDRRSLSVIGPITFETGHHYEFAIAHITGRDTTGNSSALDVLFNATDVVSDFYACEVNIFNSYCGHNFVSISEPTPEYSLSLYPNPTNGLLNLSADQNIDEIKVYNLSGQLILNSIQPNNQIDLSHLESGVYLIEISIEGSQVIRRIVKE
jgi:hypothetical protein